MSDDFIAQEINDKLYLSSRAYVIEEPSDMPRGMAADWTDAKLNESFLWIAGRYVQANVPNKNNDYWSYDDIRSGEASIKHTPLNVLHQWDRPVGTFVETKIVHRAAAEDGAELLPEVQAVAVLWSANFPEIASAARLAHSEGQLWFSMECTAETTQCLACERTFAFRASASELCEHLANKTAARRWINPTFLGGALIFPPDKPGWADADVTAVAADLTREYANRQVADNVLDAPAWEAMMNSLGV
jgi:hypothetical protein